MRLIPKEYSLGWMPYAWTFYVMFFFAYPAMKAHTSSGEWIATIAAGALFFFLYFRGFWPGREMTSIVGLTLLAIGFYPFNEGAAAFFIYAAAFAGWLPDTRLAVWCIGIIEAIAVGQSLLLQMHPLQAVWPAVFVLIIGASNMHQQQKEVSNARLKLAHDEIAHLAKVAERERIARDLHDLLGHTLSLVVLKSELAAKLADRDVERARTEILDVERISREALTQVRHAVGGYRSGGLAIELDEARVTLSAAGIDLETLVVPLDLTPAHEAVLALAIREAVTNVVRHAEAGHCVIRMERNANARRVVIRDDGRGTPAPFGNGLNGMRERLVSIGGTLTRQNDGGTTLTITLPGDGSAAQDGTLAKERTA